MKNFLGWLYAKTKTSNGGSLVECLRYFMEEVTDLGATERTAHNYITVLGKLGFIALQGSKWVITRTGENWLKRKRGL